MKNFDRALEYYNKALLLHNNLPEPNRPQRAATLKGIGDVYMHLNEIPISLQYYQQSIIALVPEFTDSSIYSNPTESSISNSKDLIEILSAKAAAFEKYYSGKSHALRDLQATLVTYECAANLLNVLRKKITTEGSKLFLEEQRYSLHQNAIRVSMRLFKTTKDRRYVESTFYLAENSKANVLLDGLHDSEAKQFSGIPDSIIEKERALKIDLAYNETQLQKENDKKEARDSTKITLLQDKCFILNNEAQRLSALLENEYPRYYELKYKNNTATIGEIQSAIDERTGVIESSLGQHLLTTFIITKSSFDVLTIPTPPNFNKLASTFYKAIKTVDEKNYVRTGINLYDLLIRPLERKLYGKNRLVIIPDGVLYYIPFEALIANTPRQRDQTVDFTRLEYLLKSFEISYSYSSSFYLNRLQQKDSTTSNALSFVGFAPVFRDTDSNGIFHSNNALTLEKDSAVLRSITVDGKRFSELKYSEREVSLVAEDFQKKGKPGTSFLYDNASEENFKLNVGKYSCIHIATHGYINEEHPQLSMLLFSQPQHSSTTEDGVLYASEMYNLSLNADLLVLSSCQSGLGKYVKGEGIIAMTRGFFYSGAHNIIFSLWKVYDKQTNELMTEFYDHVLEGETFSSALRKSKLRLIADRSTAFPSKWSGFILVGK
jgi:CHAT domain-containing protein